MFLVLLGLWTGVAAYLFVRFLVETGDGLLMAALISLGWPLIVLAVGSLTLFAMVAEPRGESCYMEDDDE